jgi:acetamidase/formamidase
VAVHELPLDASTIHGFFSVELEPVLTVEPGDSVRFSVPNAGWWLESGRQLVSRDPPAHQGHALAGPIEVRGAQAGQTLAVRVDDVRPGSWGVTPALDVELRWELDGDVGRVLGREVRLAPFLGVLGMPPPEPGVHPTRLPRRWGGNIDCDGEVSGTAIETPVSAQVTLELRDDLPLEWPAARIDGAWLTFGFDEHLGRAARIAVDGMLALLEREHGLTGGEALALASVVVDLRVTQVVNESLGVHAVLRDDAWR